MSRRAAWTNWWVGLAGFVVLIAVGAYALAGPPDPDLWVQVVALAMCAAILVSTLVNRPRPFRMPPGPIVACRARAAAVTAVRRGTPVDPPALRTVAVDAVRREWHLVGACTTPWATFAASLMFVDPLGIGSGPARGLRIAGAVVLLAGVALIGVYGRTLARVDRADAGDRPPPGRVGSTGVT